MKVNKRELIFMGLLLGILFAAWTLVLRPRSKDMDRMEAQIQEKQRVLDEITTNRPRSLGNLKKDIKELQAIADDQQSRVPQGEKIEKVFQELSNLATDNELRIVQIRTNQTNKLNESDWEEKYPDMEKQGIELVLEGNYQGIQAFLESLEKQPRIVRIAEINLLRDPKNTETSAVQAKLQVHVFSRKGAKTS